LLKKENQFLLHFANSTAYHTQDYTTPTALVVTEATGLTQEWRDAATKTL
jgi:TrmH family RNA methyltransferase